MKKGIVIGILSIALGIIIGWGGFTLVEGNKPCYVPVLKVVGDVQNSFSIKSINDMDNTEINCRDRKVKAFNLRDIVAKSAPLSEDHKVLLIGDDGLTADINGASLDGCYVAFTRENGWEAINKLHPVSSNIKRIKEIAVVSEDKSPDYGVAIVSPDKDILNLSCGQMLSRDLTIHPYFEGKSSVEKDGQVYQAGIYTSHRVIKLKDLVSFSSGVIVMGEEGGYALDDGDGYLELKDNSINYVSSDMKSSVEKVRGIMVDAPNSSVMDTYYDALHYIENGENVLIIYIDGFGYHQYKYAMEREYAPFMKTLPAAKKVSTVYTPVTNAGFAAMISGKSPAESGVYSRAQKSLNVPTIFDSVKKMGKKSLLVESNIKILNTEVEPKLNMDNNSNGTSEDEIYETVMSNIDEGYNLMLVHFHSFDDAGHSYGDIHEKTMERIKVIDGYVKDMVEKWRGKVIIVSDHGMHSTEDGGSHGSFRNTDMFVPYIVTEGGVKR